MLHTPDLILLTASGVASLFGTFVLLVLHRRFRTVVAASWAAVLGVIAANDFMQVIVGVSQTSAHSRLLGAGQVVFGSLTTAALLIAVSEPEGAVVRARRALYGGGLVLGLLMIALLLWTEPAALRETPGAWYRTASNRGLLLYFGTMILAICVLAWITAMRLRTAGRLLIAVGVTLILARPFLLSWSLQRGGQGAGTMLVLMVALVMMIVVLHYGIVIEVMDEKLKLDVASARRAEMAVRNEQLGFMAEGIAAEVATLFRSALERTRALRAPSPVAPAQGALLHELESALHQGVSLAEDLRAFASGDRRSADTIDLAEHVRSHAPMLHWVLGEPHTLACEGDPRELPVRITPERATHILTDLMRFVRRRAPGTEPLRVVVRSFARDLSHPLRVDGTELSPGEWVLLVVSLEGRGVGTAPLGGIAGDGTPGVTAAPGDALAVVSTLLRDAGGVLNVSTVFGSEEEVVECWFPLVHAALPA